MKGETVTLRTGHYSRYADDPKLVYCPRANSGMTPCAARDGDSATYTSKRGSACVGCDIVVADLLRDIVKEITEVK